MNSNFLESIYNSKFGTQLGVKSLGWGSIESQEIRFKILLEIGYESNDSLLDVGCGYGDLSKYVNNYTGIDIRKSAIEISKEKYDAKFYQKSIFDISDRFNWVVGSGIFCFPENWKEITFSTINKMYELCDKGVSINFLSDKGLKKDPDMKYCSIEEVKEVISEITGKIVIRDDYLPNDFTAYLYKNYIKFNL